MIASESIELPLARAATASSASWLESVSHHYGAVKVDAGILLGSTRVHIETRGKAVVQPSRVAVDPRGKVLAVGEVAERMEGREPTEVRVLHPVREGAVVEPELARQLVSRLLSPGAHLAAAIAGDLSAVERAALQSVLLSAGARQVYQVDQAVLASVGAGQRLLQPEACLVVHLGCETTEMAVFALGSRLWGTTLRWGTSHMDRALIEEVRRNHQIVLDIRVAERLRLELGHALEAEGSLEVSGQGLEDGQPAPLTLQAEEVCSVLRPFLERLSEQLCQVLAQVSPEGLGDLIAGGGTLTGPGARLKGLGLFLSQRSRLRLVPADSPGEAVARGLGELLRHKALRQVLLARREERPTVRSSRSGWLVAGLALATSALLTVGYLGELRAGQANPVEKALGQVLDPAVARASDLVEPASLEQDRTAAVLSEKDRQIRELASQNQRLEGLLKARNELSTARPVAARVVARDPGGWMSFCTLDVGSRDGIRVGNPVTTAEGLVGQVTEVRPDTCRVRLLTDSRAVAAGRVSQRKASGVLQGVGASHLELRYLDPDARVKNGDLVVTSGQDGQFPEGLKVGRVQSVRLVSESNYQAALVAPLAPLDSMRTVLVLQTGARSVSLR